MKIDKISVLNGLIHKNVTRDNVSVRGADNSRERGAIRQNFKHDAVREWANEARRCAERN